MVSLSLAIPAYNEDESLEAVVQDCLEVLRTHLTDFEIILLDDGSTDQTRAIIERLAEQYPALVKPLFHLRNEGMAAALRDAQLAASKEYVMKFDADGQYPPEMIAQCIPHLGSCDILIGQRRQKHYALYRALLSSAYRWLCCLCFGIDLVDPGGMKVIRRTLFDIIPVRSHSVFSQPERIIRAAISGYRIRVIEVDCLPRVTGKARGGDFILALSAFRDLCMFWWECHTERRAQKLKHT